MVFKKKISQLINKLPQVKSLKKEIESYKKNLKVPPGHFYSPVVSVHEIEQRESEIFKTAPRELPGINLNVKFQLSLIKKFLAYYDELPFSEKKSNQNKYYYENTYYSYSDAIFLYSIIRNYNPNKIIEVGSGFSSALMIDTNRMFFNNNIELTFIEPYPDRLKSLTSSTDKYRLLEQPLQNININLFSSLQANDILFIDSTHVVKTGSDVNYLLFEILPILKSGVKIHFHDIFYPFEYPKKWVIKDKRSWNEDYFMRAFLMYNNEFEIIVFNSFLQKLYKEWFEKNMPLCLKNVGGSIWLSKK